MKSEPLRVDIGLYQDDVKRVTVEIEGGVPLVIGATFTGRVVEIAREKVER